MAAASASTLFMIRNYKSVKPASIVLAEDNPGAARLVEIALRTTGLAHELRIAYDGDQAIKALEQSTDLLLLDLHMPGTNGFEVLQHIKQDTKLRRIPVVMFTSSNYADDVNKAYDLYANAYVRKPASLPELCVTLDAILHFWLRTATMPA
jgi:CheY-like chemotaxis protein